MQLSFTGIPWFLGHVIHKMLQSPRCTPDHVLLIADALEEQAKELPAQTVYREPCDHLVAELRNLAATYDTRAGAPANDEEGGQ